jgi:hypothetical protein
MLLAHFRTIGLGVLVAAVSCFASPHSYAQHRGGGNPGGGGGSHAGGEHPGSGGHMGGNPGYRHAGSGYGRSYGQSIYGYSNRAYSNYGNSRPSLSLSIGGLGGGLSLGYSSLGYRGLGYSGVGLGYGGLGYGGLGYGDLGYSNASYGSVYSSTYGAGYGSYGPYSLRSGMGYSTNGLHGYQPAAAAATSDYRTGYTPSYSGNTYRQGVVTSNRQPSGATTPDLRPGMVLPDGSTVISVGPIGGTNSQSTQAPAQPARAGISL